MGSFHKKAHHKWAHQGRAQVSEEQSRDPVLSDGSRRKMVTESREEVGRLVREREREAARPL